MLNVLPGGSSAKLAVKYGDEVLEAGSKMCRPGNSFTGDTLVLMANGTRKPIKDVRLGDRVMAADPLTGERGPRHVVDLIRHGGLHTIVSVRLSDGSAINATDRHPFWVDSQGAWIDAIDLKRGDVVVTADGEHLTVSSAKVSERDLTAYNLSVADLNTYHVDDSEVLVHNTDPCGYTPAGGFGDSDLDEVAQAIYQHVGAGDVPGRPSLEQIREALTRGVPEVRKQRDGTLAQEINYQGVRVIINENSPWRSTAYFPGG